jgi:cytochrome oxidase Cu insertion factor (SCO1/SenC/PrrC family)
VTSAALLLAPLTCAVVLLISGAAKVGNQAATRDSFISMGLPRALRSEALVTTLPYAELTLGVLLLVTWSWPLAVVAAVATALFAAYWVLVLRVLRQGEEVDCGCFGALGDDRVSGTTLARNSLLVVLAALATAFGAAGSGVLPALGDFETADWWWLALTAAVAATAVLVVGLRQPESVSDEDLLDYDRTPIPFALLEDASGTRTTLRQLAGQRPQLLVFLSSSCWACETVAGQLPDWVSRLGPVEVSTVFTEPLDALPEKIRPADIPAWFDVGSGATDTFANGRPSAVLLGADGSLAGGPVTGAGDVAAFVEDILAELAAAPELPPPTLMEPATVILGGHDDDHGEHDGHGSDDGHGHA